MQVNYNKWRTFTTINGDDSLRLKDSKISFAELPSVGSKIQGFKDFDGVALLLEEKVPEGRMR